MTSELTTMVGAPEQVEPSSVGHKFARLVELRRAGLRVPDLFCLPATAFDAASRLALADLPAPPRPGAEPEQVAAWCSRAAQALRDLRMPAEWAEEVWAAFDEQFGPTALVAVRACAVPARRPEDGAAPAGEQPADDGEDGRDDPFAGLSDSFLYVPRDLVPDRIIRCWASAFSDRGVRYRMWRGLCPTKTRIAVGIQRMVPGTRSFVAFSRDPRPGGREAVVAAAYGIGEGVVQEKADIDHFFVADGRVTARTVQKRRMVGPVADGTELAVVAVPAELTDAPVLTEAQAIEVAELAGRVERFYGCPQDIEGTITDDGLVHLVQARPVSTATGGTGERRYWSNHNITESYPGVSTVLTYSQAQEFYRRAFGDLYHRMGVPRRRFEATRHRLEQLVGFLDGRIYYRLDAWHALHAQMPLFELVRSEWENSMGVVGPARDQPRWSRRRAWAALPGVLLRALRHPAQVRAFLRWWDGVLADADTLDGRSPEQLIDFYRRLWSAVSARWGVTLTNSMYGLLIVTALRQLLDRWAGGDRRLLVGLLVGGRENRSLQAVRASIRLAELVAEVPELRDALLHDGPERSPDERVWRDLTAGRYGEPLATAATAYVRRFGDRALHDLKLEEPTPRQRPWTVLEVIRPYLGQGLTEAGNRADERRAALLARQELARVVPARHRRLVLRTLAAALRASARMREDTRFCRTQLYGLSREVTWRLGAELVRTGRLADRTDICHLTVAEVLGSFDGTLPGSDLRGLVALRRAEHELYGRLAAKQPLLATEPDRPLALALADAVPIGDGTVPSGTGHLQGLGSSGGRVRAPARLVLTPDVTAESCRGAILVARETDPGWLSLMLVAKGLIVERGTLLSHTAITGRLLGIPTIVAVPEATARIPDGAVIDMDASAGTVHILEEPAR
ncbi:PEP/pyruvate-binding domain-containing protein [Micromonospora sp. BQ11]|uniref:PEP/pyruvate-binding domain-containing protein n=1 Tax=Micromonospora sp. BQ11 TaxID=3452212 RepID=UPI003F8CD980